MRRYVYRKQVDLETLVARAAELSALKARVAACGSRSSPVR